jgi:hypothetical protein
LINNFGFLINYTEIYEASQFTGNLNWKNTEHKVYVDNQGNYTVSSETYSGYGSKKEELLSDIKRKITESRIVEKEFISYIKDMVTNIEENMKKEKIFGQCEHTFVFFGKNEDINEIRYFQMPIRLRGIPIQKMNI